MGAAEPARLAAGFTVTWPRTWGHSSIMGTHHHLKMILFMETAPCLVMDYHFWLMTCIVGELVCAFWCLSCHYSSYIPSDSSLRFPIVKPWLRKHGSPIFLASDPLFFARYYPLALYQSWFNHHEYQRLLITMISLCSQYFCWHEIHDGFNHVNDHESLP